MIGCTPTLVHCHFGMADEKSSNSFKGKQGPETPDFAC
jgi:hypothetical protein